MTSLGESVEIGRGQTVVVDGVTLRNDRVVYEHDEENEATIAYLEATRNGSREMLVVSIPGQSYFEGHLVSVLGEDHGLFVLRVDRPGLGHPFELAPGVDVAIDGIRLSIGHDARYLSVTDGEGKKAFVALARETPVTHGRHVFTLHDIPNGAFASITVEPSP